MARFSHHEACPSCGSRDNLGRYDDGSAFCFGCKYRERATHAPSPKELLVADSVKDSPRMPDDVGHNYSQEAVNWLAQYNVSVQEAIQRKLLWSPSKQQLIFDMENLWQARNFGERKLKSKYFTAGDVNDHLPIYSSLHHSNSIHSGDGDLGNFHHQGLVLVEDCVSAIRIARQCDAMPILGSHISNLKLNRLARLYSSLIVWLDSDKWHEACETARRAQMLGMNARVLYTELDPKCYTDTNIKELLTVL